MTRIFNFGSGDSASLPKLVWFISVAIRKWTRYEIRIAKGVLGDYTVYLFGLSVINVCVGALATFLTHVRLAYSLVFGNTGIHHPQNILALVVSQVAMDLTGSANIRWFILGASLQHKKAIGTISNPSVLYNLTAQ